MSPVGVIASLRKIARRAGRAILNRRSDGYTPRSYGDLKARSLILAAGVEELTAKLPPIEEYASARPPAVKWIVVPDTVGDLRAWDDVEDSYCLLRALIDEVTPDLELSVVDEDYGYAFWVWDNVRPTAEWVGNRLPQIYLLARASDCHLEGWTYEDDWAWQLGLSKVIERAGFDPSFTRPGQM